MTTPHPTGLPARSRFGEGRGEGKVREFGILNFITWSLYGTWCLHFGIW
jgi:hypothetical protein